MYVCVSDSAYLYAFLYLCMHMCLKDCFLVSVSDSVCLYGNFFSLSLTVCKSMCLKGGLFVSISVFV